MENREFPHFKSPEFRQVTERTYEQYLEFLSLTEENLRGKKMLDVGAGLSNFVEEVNKRFSAEGTHAIGVDPVYAFFDHDFKKFETAAYNANLLVELDYGIKPGRDFPSESEEARRMREEFYQDFYRKVQESRTYLAASHQVLPFENASIDLVIGNNSLTIFKEKVIIRNGLDEILRVLKNNGEARLRPFYFHWNNDKRVMSLDKAESSTPEDMEEMARTGILPDRKLLEIAKAFEIRGIAFYSFGTTIPPRRQGEKDEISYGNIIIRKDDQIPVVDEAASDFHDLRRVHFSQAVEDYYIPSEVVRAKTEET